MNKHTHTYMPAHLHTYFHAYIPTYIHTYKILQTLQPNTTNTTLPTHVPTTQQTLLYYTTNTPYPTHTDHTRNPFPIALLLACPVFSCPTRFGNKFWCGEPFTYFPILVREGYLWAILLGKPRYKRVQRLEIWEPSRFKIKKCGHKLSAVLRTKKLGAGKNPEPVSFSNQGLFSFY